METTEINQPKTAKFPQIITAVLAVLTILVGGAMADMNSDISNITMIMNNMTIWMNSTMGTFMQWPLVLFVVLGLFITFIGIVGGLLMRRKRRR